MDAVILAAGYATRLYPLTLNKAKPLLNVRGKPIINYIADKLDVIPEIDKIYVVTNDKFYKDFRGWLKGCNLKKEVVIINDETKSDGDKLGAIGDINLVIKEKRVNTDLIVIAGDNLFDFDLRTFIDFFKKHGLSVAAYRYPFKQELNGYGIMELDKNNRVIGFQEKPRMPKSDLVALCMYGFPKNKLSVIRGYIEEGNNKDAPGYYIEWLVSKEKVSSCVLTGLWYDIGTPEAYERAEKEYGK